MRAQGDNLEVPLLDPVQEVRGRHELLLKDDVEMVPNLNPKQSMHVLVYPKHRTRTSPAVRT